MIITAHLDRQQPDGTVQQGDAVDVTTALTQPVTSSEAAAALAALRAALPDVPSDAAMQRACVALAARLLLGAAQNG